jgi:hypothetical protein
MDANTRRIIEMGRRALAFAEAHPEQTPANLPALSQLKELLTRADMLIIQQRDGISEVRAATIEKREIRRRIRRTHLPHLSRVAEAAGTERPELAQKFQLPSEGMPYLAFRSAVQGILTEAKNEKELLVRFGMVEPAPDSLGEALAQFDRAAERGVSGRRAHVGARAELAAIADEVLQQVRQLDGLIRFSFAQAPEALAAWRSASNTFGPTRAGNQPVARPNSPATSSPSGTIEPAA